MPQHSLHYVLIHSMYMIPSLMSFLIIQGMYPPQVSTIYKNTIFHTCVSLCSSSIFYHFPMSFFCRLWGIHQGPPSMSLFLSTSTHHMRIRLRNQLLPWDLHASMASLLASKNRFTSLTSDRMIP
jgi:hypothetical protein